VWEESGLSEYIYPAGHPRQGLPRDAASVEAILHSVNDSPSSPLNALAEVDRPQLLLEKRFPLNNLCGSLDREDPASVESFAACFTGLPDDPRFLQVTIWVPAPADHPGATTLREHFNRLFRARAERLVTGPRCRG